MTDEDGRQFLYDDSDFVVSSSTIGKRLSSEHEAILLRVRRRQLERAVALSAERRPRWGLPELAYRRPTA
jgi:hypothetical protein